MRTLSTIPPGLRSTTAPRPTGRLASARRGMAEMTPDAIEQIAQRVAQLLHHEPQTINDGPTKPPELIDAGQLARRFGLTRTWIYENSARLGAIEISDGPRPRLRFDPQVASQALQSRQRRTEPIPATGNPRPTPTRRRRTPPAVPLLPIHERRVRGAFARLRPAHRRGR
ncbi:MAG TPA: hypothetical protein VID48_04040 [Solirubrobacteraceae bacterium]|jgi:hypothetical protein